MKKLKAIVIGAGMRGMGYTDIMKEMDDKFQVVGVAEPGEDRRNYVKNKHNIPEECCFDTWEKILDVPRFADVAIVSTMDRDHSKPAIKALELGYDLLLEKPAAPTPEECVAIKNAAEKYGRKVMICHVLRYTKFYLALRHLLRTGAIGEIVSMIHNEPVGAVHQSHSFVRGNWGNEERSSCMLLQKSCHDLDIIQWLLEKDCKKIQSFGSLKHFRRENAPEGSPEYCIEGCPKAKECPYNAVKLYASDEVSEGVKEWFRTAATHLVHPTLEDMDKVLRETQYGKCVYKCDNDVVDHQTVNMEFEDDITVTFTMSAFYNSGRMTTILGTEGYIVAEVAKDTITVYKQDSSKPVRVIEDVSGITDGTIVGGHGGGDGGIIGVLYEYLNGQAEACEVSEIDISCRNHMLVFAAEKSRKEGCVVDMEEYMKSVGM